MDSLAKGGVNLFDCLALNRSIKKLSLIGRFDFDQRFFYPFQRMLLPFFQNNRSFQCLSISFYSDEDGRYHLLTHMLTRFDSLKEFCLLANSTTCDPVVMNDINGLLEALHFHAGLEKLTLNKELGGLGLQELANLLQNPRSNIMKLRLCRIDNEGAYILLSGLNGNEKLK